MLSAPVTSSVVGGAPRGGADDGSCHLGRGLVRGHGHLDVADASGVQDAVQLPAAVQVPGEGVVVVLMSTPQAGGDVGEVHAQTAHGQWHTDGVVVARSLRGVLEHSGQDQADRADGEVVAGYGAQVGQHQVFVERVVVRAGPGVAQCVQVDDGVRDGVFAQQRSDGFGGGGLAGPDGAGE